MKIKNTILLLLVSFYALSCVKSENKEIKNYNMESLIDVIERNKNSEINKKIFFGHQSVGGNIIEGVNFAKSKVPEINLKTLSNGSISNEEGLILYHIKIGQNNNPKSKVDDFCKKMESGLIKDFDFVGFKFCYVDINKKTDVDELFKYYDNAISNLSNKFPEVRIIHYTVPLRIIQKGFKGRIKSFLGKDVGLDDNIARNKFNTLVREKYGTELTFDLAGFESSLKNGIREYTMIDEKKIYSLVPSYSNDGGHLSKEGKSFVGEQYLIFLLNLCYE